ncbi:uncharacterized protein LOC133833890 isoform X1 [Humulus lupulus]|uniref:uncharacterized protein LOC133833890 isoform X1 n=1 Tax=Humulus lupulus TaxID=3486 RepID=UPI002B40893E|nr:uncharacterized protein LOC133833890 isoform X1 [Humulus lupulus]
MRSFTGFVISYCDGSRDWAVLFDRVFFAYHFFLCSEIDNQGSSLFHVPLTIAIKLKPKRRENSLHFTHTNVISMALPPTSKRKRQLKLKENSFRGGKIRGRLENVYRW